jgi:hypothetical protein
MSKGCDTRSRWPQQRFADTFTAYASSLDGHMGFLPFPLLLTQQARQLADVHPQCAVPRAWD